MSAPLRVDIIIDNYNYDRFLASAIDSALAQTHAHTTVIVVDDGSTDRSREIIAEYGDRVVSVLKDNGGQASALNAGVARSSGDLVIFLDSDDVLRPETAAWVAAEAQAHPDVCKFQYRLEVIDGDGVPTGVLKPERHLPLPNGDLRQQELAGPFDIAWLPMSGAAFRRSVVDRLMPMPEHGYELLADMYLQHLSALLGPVISIDRVGGAYRVHGGNNHEVRRGELDLRQIRRNIRFADALRPMIASVADEEHQQRPAEILSVADLANRMVSFRADRSGHPLPHDRRSRLTIAGCRAAARRKDVAPALRAAFGAWFVVMAVAPRPWAEHLGEMFLLPERRPKLNGVLARQHRAASEPR